MSEKQAERFLTVDRRRFLKGLGACHSLPDLDSITPLTLVAAESKTVAATAHRRMAFMYFPNVGHHGHCWPTGACKEFVMNRTMQPLESLKGKLQGIASLDHRNTTPG